ncbi:MAG: thermostable dipeptidase [Gemmatimonadales bacterium]|jgi:membrane dipeptidase|nr:thermostable dipeptidase [Gemmatimonadales bacterium]MBT7693279.1 thermostable dipeptidase [Gemmatimonadales bacterium]
MSQATGAAPLVADAHNDLLMACLHRRERGVLDPFGDDWLPGLREGGVIFQVLPIFTEEQFVGEGALRRSLEMIDVARDIASMHSAEVGLVEDAGDIDSVIDSGRIALLVALEGAEPIGSSPSMFETMWRLGVRMASLTWNRRTMMADGVGESDTGGGLTSLGIDSIAEMERLGMILDVSHLSAAGLASVDRVAKRPYVATHSSCRLLCDHPRNLSDDQISMTAQSGGFIGINSFGPFIDTVAPTIERYVDHVEHAMELAGSEKVCIGADFIEDLVRFVDPILGKVLVRPEDLAPTVGLSRPSHYPNLTTALVERLGPEQAERVSSRNMLDFFRRALPDGG